MPGTWPPRVTTITGLNSRVAETDGISQELGELASFQNSSIPPPPHSSWGCVWQRWPHPLTQNTSSLSVPSRLWELGAWPFLAIPGKDMGALNWASMFHRAWSTRGLAQPGQGRQSPCGPHLPEDCGARQGAEPLCQGASRAGVLGPGPGFPWQLLAACCPPSALLLPAPSLTQLEWGSERKAGPPLWALG